MQLTNKLVILERGRCGWGNASAVNWTKNGTLTFPFYNDNLTNYTLNYSLPALLPGQRPVRPNSRNPRHLDGIEGGRVYQSI